MRIKALLVLSMLGLASYFGCLDEIDKMPPCFLDGSAKSVMDDVISVNICCDAQSGGARFCKDLFKDEGYGAYSELAQCTEEGYCRLCEVGVDCSCLGDRDCGTDQSCVLTDDPSACEVEGRPETPKRCAVCQ